MASELAQLREQFFEELSGSCEDLEQDFMTLEQEPHDLATSKSVLREIHTIKGNAGLVGESLLQSFCHTLESTIERLKADGRPALVAELGLQAVDLLREAAGGGGDGVEERITRFRETLEHAGRPTAAAEAAGPDTARSAADSMTLEQWKALVRAFAQVEDALEALLSDDPTQRQARRAGMAVVDLVEGMKQSSGSLGEQATVLELTLSGLTSLPKTGLPQAITAFAPLLRSLLQGLRESLSDLFRNNNFSVTVTVKNLSLLAALETELRRRNSSPVLILRLEVEYESLERHGNAYDSFWSLASMPEHTVAFVLPWSSMVDKAATFLRQAIGTVPLVSTEEWQTLRQIAHHEITE